MLKKLSNGLYYLKIEEDSFYKTGFCYGESCKELIHMGIKLYDAFLIENFKLSFKKLVEDFMKDTQFLEDILKYTPEIHEEMQGLADGAGVTLEEIFTYSALDDTLVYTVNELPKLHGEHCTSIGCHKRGALPSILAHNSDFYDYYDGTQIVLDIIYPNSTRTLTATFAGMIAQAGVNNRGLAVTPNTLASLNSQKRGLSEVVILKGILSKGSLEEALAWIKEIPHSAGVNYCIGDRVRSVCVEGSKNSVCILEAAQGVSFVAHTNHQLLNEDVNKTSILTKALEIGNPETGESIVTTKERLALATTFLNEKINGATVEDIKQLLGMPPILNKDPLTLMSTVIELGDDPVMWVSGKDVVPENYLSFKFD